MDSLAFQPGSRINATARTVRLTRSGCRSLRQLDSRQSGMFLVHHHPEVGKVAEFVDLGGASPRPKGHERIRRTSRLMEVLPLLGLERAEHWGWRARRSRYNCHPLPLVNRKPWHCDAD